MIRSPPLYSRVCGATRVQKPRARRIFLPRMPPMQFVGTIQYRNIVHCITSKNNNCYTCEFRILSPDMIVGIFYAF